MTRCPVLCAGSLVALLSLLARLPTASPLCAVHTRASTRSTTGLEREARHALVFASPLCCRLRGGAVYNASWEPSYRQGFPTIWAAARIGDLDELRRALETHAPDSADDEGRTALHWATIAGRLELVSELLERGASPLTMDNYGWAPLHCAASCGKARVLSAVLSAAQNTSAGADTFAADMVTADERGATPLLLACGKNDTSAVRVLLSSSTAAVSTRCKDGFTPLLRAGMQGNVEIVDQLLASGAGINEQDPLGNSSLHYMCNGLSKSQIPQALALLERGANPLLRNAAGDTPVDYLDFDVARLLARDYLAMKRRKGAATRSEDDQHALELSIMHESVENVALLREGPEYVRTRMRTRSMCSMCV